MFGNNGTQILDMVMVIDGWCSDYGQKMASHKEIMV
jgi:hypothetical protein